MTPSGLAVTIVCSFILIVGGAEAIKELIAYINNKNNKDNKDKE